MFITHPPISSPLSRILHQWSIIAGLVLFSAIAPAQVFKKEVDSLQQEYKALPTDEKKIDYLNDIINASLPDNPHYGDSLAAVMLNIAEFSRNRELMCQAYLNLARQYMNYENLRDNRATGRAYAERLLQLAKTSNLDRYVVLAYLALARGSRNSSDNQRALEYNNLALSLAANYGSDSLTSICYSSLAHTWMNLNNKLAGFQNRLTARDFAEKSKDKFLIISTMQDLADFYKSIGEFEKSKDIYFQSMPLSRRYKEWEFLMVAQRELAAIYIQTGQSALAMNLYADAMHIADSVGRAGYKINMYLDILNYLINYETAEKAIDYLDKQPAMTQFLVATDAAYNFDKLRGFYFFQKKKYDSADYYFQKVLPFEQRSNNSYERFDFFGYLANMYRQRNRADKNFFYLKLCENIADSVKDIELQSRVSLDLDSFYLAKGDYKNALQYYTRYNVYTDSLRKLSEQKGLLSLEIDNENKRKIKEEEEKEAAIRVKENIQYMGITAAIVSVFILLVVLGAFKISIPLIKGLGFIAFIFLFEFLILLADKPIHHWTDGEPWKILSFKIVLIAMLYPLHHWLEHEMIKYLVTKDMLKGRSLRFPFWKKKVKEKPGV